MNTSIAAKILLVDDTPSKLYSLASLLENAGHEVVQARSGKEALRTLLKQDFALILLDVSMPGMDGFETAELIRQRKNSEYTPIIFITGISTSEMHMHKGYSLGAVDYIFTPVIPEILCAKVAVFVELFRHREQIKESEERFRSVTETALCGILTVNTQGSIEYANPSVERMFGYDPGDLEGRQLSLLLPRKFRNMARLSNLQQERVRRMLGRTFVIQAKRRNGKLFPVELSIARRGEGGRTLFTAMLLDVTAREAAQEQVRCYTNELEEAQQKMMTMMRALEAEVTERKSAEEKILQISEREQRRLGEELHDGLGQTLTGISFMTKVMAKKLENEGSSEAENAAQISKYVNDAIGRTRDLARGFYPIELEKNGLISALHDLAAREHSLFGVECEIFTDYKNLVPDLNKAAQVYRIAQEAIENAIKHGDARKITVRLAKENGHVNLTVQDDGKGIPKALPKSRGMGLQIMKYRAGMLAGSFDIKRGLRKGTVVICSFPDSSV
jgi:two-component system, LuxR family, sensor kinase FixL